MSNALKFEQLKKQQKKGKKGGKKDEDKAGAAAAVKEDKHEGPIDTTEESHDAVETSAAAAAAAAAAPIESADTPEKVEEDVQEDIPAEDEASGVTSPPAERPGHARKQSESAQSRQRSESFRQGSVSSPSGLKSPSLPTISAEDEVQDIYRKQTSRIEELEKENKTLRDAQTEHETRLRKTEEELEQLRESSGDVAELKTKAVAADERAVEIEKLVQTSLVKHACRVLMVVTEYGCDISQASTDTGTNS